MFGIGAQEVVLIGLLSLVIFGPGKLPGMARDLGRLVHKARASVEEFKSEFALEKEPEHRKSRRNRRAANGREPEGSGRSLEPAENQDPKDVRRLEGDQQPEHSAKDFPEEASLTPRA